MLHPPRRIVPYRPHLDNQYVLTLDAIFGTHLVASVRRRSASAKRSGDSLYPLQFNFGKCQLTPFLSIQPETRQPLNSPLPASCIQRSSRPTTPKPWPLPAMRERENTKRVRITAINKSKRKTTERKTSTQLIQGFADIGVVAQQCHDATNFEE
jgi:hypothetical protein